MAVSWGPRQQKALRRRLLSALRSGEFNQIEGCLEAVDKDGNIVGNCIMGVAVRVFEEYTRDNKIDVELEFKVVENHGVPVLVPYITKIDGHTKVLPEVVREAFGFSSNEGHFDKPISNLYTTLIDMNDSGMSFRKIARVIDRAPKGLFLAYGSKQGNKDS